MIKLSKFHEAFRMAAEGIMFPQFYTSAAICSPSRASLLTGYKYLAHESVKSWLKQPYYIIDT